MKLKELAVKHPYYCSSQNYYSREPEVKWNTASDFLDQYEDADIDFNLIFRWDVYAPDEDHKQYQAEVFVMHQQKGIFAPHYIELIEEKDVERFVSLLRKHKTILDEIWKPL